MIMISRLRRKTLVKCLQKKVNDRAWRKQQVHVLRLLFGLWMVKLCDTSPAKFIVEGGTVLGNRAGSQELIQLGERIRQKRKDSHLTQETFAECRDQCQAQ